MPHRCSRPKTFLSKVMAFSGAATSIYQILLYPWLADKLGIVSLQHFCGVSACLLLVAVPNIKYFSYDEGSLMVVSALAIALTECFLVTVSVWLD